MRRMAKKKPRTSFWLRAWGMREPEKRFELHLPAAPLELELTKKARKSEGGTSRDSRQLELWAANTLDQVFGDARGPKELTAPGLAAAPAARVRAGRRDKDSREVG